jgi:pimeloyl-ACP methyl ester carboxylesterase
VAGPAGLIACAPRRPGAGPPRGVAVLCHPHPQHGGTMDNKVVQTLARALVQLGYTAVRFNFRGVGGSEGSWDQGRGEVDDALAVVAAQLRAPGLPLVLGGFSFGGYVASQAAAQRACRRRAQRLVLVGPGGATSRWPRCRRTPWSCTANRRRGAAGRRASTGRARRPCRSPCCPAPGTSSTASSPLLKHIVLGAWGLSLTQALPALQPEPIEP